jgi:hypothetical protein
MPPPAPIFLEKVDENHFIWQIGPFYALLVMTYCCGLFLSRVSLSYPVGDAVLVFKGRIPSEPALKKS